MWLAVLTKVLARPTLWPTALRQLLRSTPDRWYRRRPFLPMPTREYIHFRMTTQYGPDARLDPNDVISYLQWCRQWNASL